MISAEGVCAIESARCAVGLLWALERVTMRFMCGTYVAAGVYWRISHPSAAE
jgi:hypothetical protein